MKCDQDLCLNLRYDLKKLLWQDELNPRVRCAFGNVLLLNAAFRMILTLLDLSSRFAQINVHELFSYVTEIFIPGLNSLYFLSYRLQKEGRKLLY